MAIAHLLEDFSPPLAEDGPAKMMSAVALEDQRLLSFEQGYSAGWDDAISAQTQGQKQASLALARTLEDASFTYHEALSQFSSSVEPLFTALFERVLPKIMHETVGGRLGVKASGGIRDIDFATELIAAGATRLGLSSSRAILDGVAATGSY